MWENGSEKVGVVSSHLIGSQVSPDMTWARVIVDKRDLRVSFAAHGCRTALKVCEGSAVRSFIVQVDVRHQWSAVQYTSCRDETLHKSFAPFTVRYPTLIN